jgi:hypothetical protein
MFRDAECGTRCDRVRIEYGPFIFDSRRSVFSWHIDGFFNSRPFPLFCTGAVTRTSARRSDGFRERARCAFRAAGTLCELGCAP